MCGDHLSPPADAAGPFERISSTLESDPAALGERLLVLGSGPIAVQGAGGAILALDSRGAGVLVAAFSSLPRGASAELSDELDRLAQLGKDKLRRAATHIPNDREIAGMHSEFFNLPNDSRPSLNGDQRVIVVLDNKPGIDTWKDLKADLGPSLSGVFAVEDGRLAAQPFPEQLSRRVRSWSFWRWVAAAAVVSGVAGFWLAVTLDSEDPPTASGALVSAPSVVAGQVSPDATHTQWIGQRRVGRTSNGSLVAAYATAEGLQIVRDQANQGKTWQAPQTIGAVQPLSFAMGIDAASRIHVAFKDAQGIGYLNLQEGPTGLIPSTVLRLDAATTSPVVDIAVDSSTSVAHVVWVKGDTDQQPVWAAVSAPSNQEPMLLRSEALAEPGNVLTVLTNVGVGPNSQLIATFRRGDSLEGWFARYLDGVDPSLLSWSPEERLPTADALYGAATVAVDSAGNAHLVLRDNTTYGLTYLKRSQGSWGPSETIVDVETTEEIDFPSVSPDSSSEIVYVAFQDSRTTGKGQIKVATRDPAAGWSAPLAVASADALLYPTTVSPALGNSVLLATAQATPQIHAFRVTSG